MKTSIQNVIHLIFLLLVILVSMTGFWSIYFGPDASPTFYQNLHVLTTFMWLGLLLVQLIFIVKKNNSYHKRLGTSIFIVGPLLIATLIMLSVHSASKSAARGEADMLVIQNIFPALEIGVLILLGFIFRKNRKLHGHLLLSTALLFFGIALFFTLISFVPAYKIEGPETFYRFENAAIAATNISVALGLILFFIQWKSGWPWLMVSVLFFLNAFVNYLIAEADQLLALTIFIGSINEFAAFFSTFVLVLVILFFSLIEKVKLVSSMGLLQKKRP